MNGNDNGNNTRVNVKAKPKPKATLSPSASPISVAPTAHPTDWYAEHVARGQQYANEIDEWRQNHAKQLVALDNNNKKIGKKNSNINGNSNNKGILEWDELADGFRKAIIENGLVLMGDSTVRILYGFIWCLVDGLAIDGDVCIERLVHLKATCHGAVIGPECKQKAEFSNFQGKDQNKSPKMRNLATNNTNNNKQDNDKTKTTTKAKDQPTKANSTKTKDQPTKAKSTKTTLPNTNNEASLELLPFYKIGSSHWPDVNKVFPPSSPKRNKKKIVVAGMPCLHALWSPGFREMDVKPNLDDLPRLLDSYYNYLETAFPNQWVVSLPVTLALDKLGAELDLIEWYLKGIPLDAGDAASKKLSDWYTIKERSKLPSDPYSGLIPVMTPNRQHHEADDTLFDDYGVKACTAVGLRNLPPGATVVDIQAATVGGSDDTDDGRHYHKGQTVRKELTLLLKTIRVMNERQSK